MNAVHYALSLLRAWLLQSTGIVGELMLVDARRAADGCQCDKRLVGTKHCCCIQKVVLKLIVAITQPLRYIVAISQHVFHVEVERLFGFFLKFTVGISGKHHSTWYILTQ